MRWQSAYKPWMLLKGPPRSAHEESRGALGAERYYGRVGAGLASEDEKAFWERLGVPRLERCDGDAVEMAHWYRRKAQSAARRAGGG